MQHTKTERYIDIDYILIAPMLVRGNFIAAL